MVCLHLHNTQAYRRLVLVIHPDKAKGDKAEAGAWFERQEQQTDSTSTHQHLAACCRLEAHTSVLLLCCCCCCWWCVPPAARKFDEVQRAYAILCDKSARGALDDYLE